MDRKKELQKMTVIGGLDELARKYKIDASRMKKAELIDAILAAENPPKKTRPPRNAASTKLKALRVARGITQREMVERTGINPGTYSQYEQGVKNFDNARINVILRVCVVLNCRIDDVMEDPEYIKAYNDYCKM